MICRRVDAFVAALSAGAFLVALALPCRAESVAPSGERLTVLVANCPGDSNYDAFNDQRISEAIDALKSSDALNVSARPSAALSPMYEPADTRTLMLAAPRLIVSHFSCFEDAKRAERERWDKERRVVERDANFGRFLQSLLAYPDVRLLIYSRVFHKTPTHLDETYPRIMRAINTRVQLLCVRKGKKPVIDFDKLRTGVRQLLGAARSEERLIPCS